VKKLLVLLLAISAYSCAEENLAFDPSPPTEEMWVCHNPESDLHGTPCEERVDTVRGNYETCYWDLNGSNYGRGHRNPESYCWLLEKEDCTDTLEYQWQEDNCHLFGDFK